MSNLDDLSWNENATWDENFDGSTGLYPLGSYETGSQPDVLLRLINLLPAKWFSDESDSSLQAVLGGIASAHAFVYSLITYTNLQTRIKTATDGWLDMIAADFFGSALVRKTGQSDAAFRSRILVRFIRERSTRASIVSVLQDLTGLAPAIFEPQHPLDTGSYGGPLIGYGVAGGYGSMLLPCQAFVTAFRMPGSGVPNVAGYGISTGGYGVASQAELVSVDMVQGAVTDSDIYAALDSVKPAGATVWVRIK